MDSILYSCTESTGNTVHTTPVHVHLLRQSHIINLSGETRKVETDRVAVGTFSGEGLSPVFQERAPWSIMHETNKAREHKKAQKEHRCCQIAPHGSAERLRCVDARLCLGV